MRPSLIVLGSFAAVLPWTEAVADVSSSGVQWTIKVTSLYRKADGSQGERVTAVPSTPAGTVPTMSSWSCRHTAPTKSSVTGRSVEYVQIDCESAGLKASVVCACGLRPGVGYANGTPLSVGDKAGGGSDVVDVVCSFPP